MSESQRQILTETDGKTRICRFCNKLSKEWMFFEPKKWVVCMDCFMEVFDKVLNGRR